MLRFKRDDGTSYPEWENKVLENIFIFQYGKFNNNPDNGGIYPIYGANGIIGGYNKYNAENSIIIGHMGANAGSVLYEKGKHFVTYNGTITKPLNANTLNLYFGYYLLLGKNLRQICAGSGQPFLSYDMLNRIKCSVPCLEEQQKIADFLSEVDNIIAMSEQEIESLEMQKKGAMQKIFSQEVRFKADDGSEYPEWEKTLLGNVCNINPKTNELDDMFFYIDLESIESGKLILKEPINKAEAPSGAQRVLEIGDVLFQTVRPYQMNHYYYENKLPMQVVASTGFAQMRLINGDNRFLYYLFYTNDFNKSVDVKCTGSNYPAINSSELAKIKVKIPCLEEQQKIADFLSEFDNAIEYAKEELEVWKNIKKGLLQQMFE